MAVKVATPLDTFHFSTGTIVLVFDENPIPQVKQPNGLPVLLHFQSAPPCNAKCVNFRFSTPFSRGHADLEFMPERTVVKGMKVCRVEFIDLEAGAML